jgi:hypothetical protein
VETDPLAKAVPRPLLPHHLLAFLLSLPERLLRFLVACLGSLLNILMGLLPRRIRRGRFYRLAVERQLKLLADDVGQAGLFPGQGALDKETATRMAVGGMADNLMMVGLSASPIWILLAASDVSSSARAFTREIADEMRAAGVIDEDSPMDDVDAVLGGLGRLSDRLADTVDMPPLSVAAMKETVSSLRAELHGVGTAALDATPDVEKLASDLLSLAEEEDRSLAEITSGVAISSVRRVGGVVVGGLVGVGAVATVAGRRVWEDVVLDYGKTIDRMRRLGFNGCLRRVVLPPRRSLVRLFHYRFLSMTELMGSLGAWRKAAWRLA